MFRVVCMRHLCELEGELCLDDSADVGDYVWDTSNMFCPRFDLAYLQLEVEQDRGYLSRRVELVDELYCASRWYVVDESGAAVYMVPQEEDVLVFAKADPFKSWQENLGITNV